VGDIKIFNSAGENDNENTITSSGSSVGRVKDLYLLKSEMVELEEKVETNTTKVENITSGAPEEMDTLKEVADSLDLESFLDALNGPKPAAGPSNIQAVQVP
jgi:hypothetical protein